MGVQSESEWNYGKQCRGAELCLAGVWVMKQRRERSRWRGYKVRRHRGEAEAGCAVPEKNIRKVVGTGM